MKRPLFSLLSVLLFALTTLGEPGHSTQQEALAFLQELKLPDSSIYWPNARSRLFMENLRHNVQYPLSMYQGSNTNFCGYAALSYLPLNNDPLQYVKFMAALFLEGKATWGRIHFDPAPEVMRAAGTLRFKGVLDIHPADQMWFLVLADHFRSYLNFFFRKYHAGSEDSFWAACNLGKFNRIVTRLLGYKIRAVGSDLIRPGIKDLYAYLQKAIQAGTTFLYVNNTYLHVKNHDKSKFGFPTHYIVLSDIQMKDDIFTIIYWDYGGRTLRQVTPKFLKKILYGVTYTLNNGHEE
ncbi:hypothetical protein Q4E93_30560 [Flavitalea sp. BT771]|uniref:hypothetical protein n=1 Tax=Flavitalea sp. BT771 TaxID=3063329 RepID=UPI0026E453E6|nr:hypothetical protein [Flavitalea sp. BT771]MDO6434996.1 hypothetical protein [Flavitalea sp. BT771]MDV6223896.1 hypothetical protein [Flavitalea sp. BT771]